jgi:hypothetical protein
MRSLCFIPGLLLILATLLDGFETILLPRRINRRIRYSRFYYRGGWAVWSRIAERMAPGRFRESMLSVFGPLSMLGLFISWITVLVFCFAVLFWSLHAEILINGQPHPASGFATYLYLSGTNYFTLGLGDLTPVGALPRFLTVAESGLGLGFLAIIISYLPVIYQAFSRREVTISLMDARAGSPPGAGEFLVRLAARGKLGHANDMLLEWEHWCAEVLESHISFPVLVYYRSQHGNQSWLASLATILDACSLMLALVPPEDPYRVELTFAMARHAVVDIGLIFGVRPLKGAPDRLPPEALEQLQTLLKNAGVATDATSEASGRLSQLRDMYDPILAALGKHFVLTLPPMISRERSADNWQRSPWMPRTPGIGSLPAGAAKGDHFD